MSALVSPDRPEAPLFSDGIGDRVVSADPTTGELVQVMRLNPSLTAVPSFEFALRERVARLANFRHLYFARVRRVDRAPAHPTARIIAPTKGRRQMDTGETKDVGAAKKRPVTFVITFLVNLVSIRLVRRFREAY